MFYINLTEDKYQMIFNLNNNFNFGTMKHLNFIPKECK